MIDNGPGIPAETIAGVLDFSMRVSSREAYVAPDRGAQGNALKTLVAMPFVLDGHQGVLEVDAAGARHRIEFTVDPIRQEPVIKHDVGPADRKNGTEICMKWPDSVLQHHERPGVGLVPGLCDQLLPAAEVQQPAGAERGALELCCRRHGSTPWSGGCQNRSPPVA